MKLDSSSPRKNSAARKEAGTVGIHIPMEWMDPMSWRLPSGKALAEFALQSGFLAPLIMRAPQVKRTSWTATGREVVNKEAPEQTGSFRESR